MNLAFSLRKKPVNEGQKTCRNSTCTEKSEWWPLRCTPRVCKLWFRNCGSRLPKKQRLNWGRKKLRRGENKIKMKKEVSWDKEGVGEFDLRANYEPHGGNPHLQTLGDTYAPNKTDAELNLWDQGTMIGWDAHCLENRTPSVKWSLWGFSGLNAYHTHRCRGSPLQSPLKITYSRGIKEAAHQPAP